MLSPCPHSPSYLSTLQGDGYENTGCYNLNQDCVGGTPGFVQVSNKVLIGGSIAPPSAVYSQQYEIKLRVFKVLSCYLLEPSAV